MKTHNLIGYSIILLVAAASAYFAPPALGPWLGMTLGMLYFTAIWFLSGVYLSDIIHMGITHGALDYKPWFIKTVTVVSNTFGIYVNPAGESHRLMKMRVAMQPVPPPAGSTGPVLARTPWMYVDLEKADQLVNFLQKGLQKIRSVPEEPRARQ